ncbi:uncharacterized protein LOC127080109 isoform X1 [Lathyrus oleraceus]|uniref:uncharacterized protein LOC127080109 isoform X1 n=1 Tax=Pisum sativum TaxID=3888 RepID=UPI0021CF4BD6|nr:uncharacterized protein LOC127080109 isoform X1 [Pisum sativum]
MATDPNLNVKTSLEMDQDDEVLDVDPISWYFDPNNNNDNITGDLVSTITERNKIVRPSSSSTRKPRSHKKLPAEWIDNWEVTEIPRKDGIKVDKSFRHKIKGFTVRSIEAVNNYEKYGELPERKSKKKLLAKKGREAPMTNEKFQEILAEDKK